MPQPFCHGGSRVNAHSISRPFYHPSVSASRSSLFILRRMLNGTPPNPAPLFIELIELFAFFGGEKYASRNRVTGVSSAEITPASRYLFICTSYQSFLLYCNCCPLNSFRKTGLDYREYCKEILSSLKFAFFILFYIF